LANGYIVLYAEAKPRHQILYVRHYTDF